MNARRTYGPVVLATLAAGGGLVLATGRPWARTTVSGTGVPDDALNVTGNQAVPLVAALGVVIATAALAVLATRGRWRQGVGVFVVLLGLGAAYLAATAAGATADAVGQAIEASPSFTGGNDPDAASTTLWRWVTAAIGLLAAALGGLIIRLAPSWPVMGGRYDAPSAARAPADPDDPADLWKALDDGRDPTE